MDHTDQVWQKGKQVNSLSTLFLKVFVISHLWHQPRENLMKRLVVTTCVAVFKVKHDQGFSIQMWEPISLAFSSRNSNPWKLEFCCNSILGHIVTCLQIPRQRMCHEKYNFDFRYDTIWIRTNKTLSSLGCHWICSMNRNPGTNQFITGLILTLSNSF